MVIVKANEESEAGTTSSEDMEKMFAEMGKYNEELVNAGIMLSGEGLLPSSKGKRILFDGARRTVVDGPFAETKELVAGFWLWQVKDIDEAVEWARRCPNPTGAEGQLEIRPIGEMEDMGESFTPELRQQEEELRRRIEEQQR
jgi:hypothetical protein